MAVRIQMRRDTAANWTANNPTLAEGELGIELDTRTWKIGYQNLPWNSLPYSNAIYRGPVEIVGNDSNVSLTITQVGSGDAFKVQDSTGPDSTPFIVKGNGDIGIGTTSPTAKLDVDGTAKFSGQITSTVATGSSPFVVSSTTKVDNLNADLLDGQSGDYYTTAGNLTGTIPSTVLGNSNLYIGTSSIGLNRASSVQSLTGVSIDGNAGTVTNGVYTTDSYSNPSWLTGLAWSKISSTPTTLAGYGITDAINTSSTSQTKNGNLTIVGTLTATDVVLTGSGTTITTTNLSVTDSLIYLSDEQFDSDSIDIGIYGAYGDINPGHYHTGLVRDASDSGKWKLISGAPEPVSNVVDFTGVTYDTLKIGALEVTSTSVVTNLNSDKLDGQDGSYYNDAANLTGTIPSTVLGNSSHYIGTTSIALNRASASQTLTGVSIDGNAGTVTNGIYTTSTLYIGTTSIALNRSSASQTLSGISIDGNAATVTNGVYTTSSYSNPSWITGLTWSKISSTPTTLAGYGITDAASSAGTFYIGTTSIGVNRPSGAQTLTGVSIDGNAATVTNGVYSSGSYSNPSWITGLAWSKISSIPTTLAGYGITDALDTSSTAQTKSGNLTVSSLISTTLVSSSSREAMLVSGSAASSTVNVDAITASTTYYTAAATSNFTLNIRGSSSVSLNSFMNTGDSVTVVFLNTCGATPYYANVIKIDGNTITPKYQYGTAFSAGNANSVDAYIFDIVKTANNTFTVFASSTKYA
jgi:Major tropism determinant N-terminal domain